MDDIPRDNRSSDPAAGPGADPATGPGADPAAGPGADPATGPGAGRPETVRQRKRPGMLWAVLAVVIAFTAGFLWQFYEASTVRGELDAAEQELVMERLRVRLGQAALAANTGNYEPARQQMSAFFGRLQEVSPALPPGVRRVADDFLTMRDDVITGLSRGNREYAAVLYGMQETLSNAIDQSLEIGSDAATPTGTGAPDDAESPAEPPVETIPGSGDEGT